MEYEKKYKEALEWMQSVYDGLHGATKEDAEHYFPELKESDDERISKEIISFLKDFEKDHYRSVNFNSWIAWLEKQSEKKSAEDAKKLDADKVIEWLNEYVADFWNSLCNPNRVVNQFKKDFGL